MMTTTHPPYQRPEDVIRQMQENRTLDVNRLVPLPFPYQDWKDDPIPEMTEERRREMVKVIHGVAEEGRVAIRNVRRDIMSDMRDMKKDGDVGEDEEHRAESELQKLTDRATGEIDALVKGKEEEILTV